MKCIVLFGAGKSSSVLVKYLKDNAEKQNWQVFVADASLEAALLKTGEHPLVKPIQVDVYNEQERASLVQKAHVVISLLPPSLHILVAKDCVAYSKHLLTASYTDDNIRALQEEIAAKDLLFLCEMGLDPGIDHMSAMQMIHRIHDKGGVITSFKSHCGGLVAPESDDNPWHYKISWNPRNVVMAGKAGASYRENKKVVELNYTDVFSASLPPVITPDKKVYGWYPNRDSLPYMELYGLQDASTFLRTTLRHTNFIKGWCQLIVLNLTDESTFYNTDGLTISDFFKEHFKKTGLEKWKADLSPQDVSIFTEQLEYIGLNDLTLINKGVCNVTDILQFILEKKLPLKATDKDMIVMLHEIEYSVNQEKYKESSYLEIKGENSTDTAMAKTVGLPLGIAAKLLLDGTLAERGLHIPVKPAFYTPVLEELQKYGIVFSES